MKTDFQGLPSKIIGENNLYDILMQAPAVIRITRGRDHVLWFANEEAFKLWGRGSEIIGKPLLEGIPELQGQGIIESFDHVFNTGETRSGKAMPVTFFVNGRKERHYLDTVYQPYYEEENDKPASCER